MIGLDSPPPERMGLDALDPKGSMSSRGWAPNRIARAGCPQERMGLDAPGWMKPDALDRFGLDSPLDAPKRIGAGCPQYSYGLPRIPSEGG